MPRKVNYSLDYEDDYDTYDDDYCDEYDANVRDNVKVTPSKNASKKMEIWQCSICTYDNDENLPYCEICGVIRDCSKRSKNSGLDKADMTSKNYGVSLMAQSVFAPVLSGTTKQSIAFQQLNGVSQSTVSNNLISFKFDVPSPDDSIYAGKNVAKASSASSTSARASTSIKEKKETAEHLSVAKTSSSVSISEVSSCISDTTGLVMTKDTAEIVSSDMQKLNLDKTGQQSYSQKKKVLSDYKPEKWMINQDQSTLEQLNLAIVGHVDSGKSTLSGRLLHLLGRVSQKLMHKFEKESKEKGKGSFAYAWAMDESLEERERGVTMTVAVAYFNTKNYHVVLLDSPGHKDFVPNMISGVTQADAAVLVVDASSGAFEAGMNGFGVGQTREHAQLIRSFGVEQLIVLVNKMDNVGYSKERFDFIKLQLGSFLRSCHFKESCVAWIPSSAMENQNLVKSEIDARLSAWYHGPCLLDAIECLHPPEREISKPLRMPICDVLGSYFLGQVATCGKLVTGAMKIGTKVLVMPSGQQATVRSMERDSNTCSVARAGDNVAISLQGIDNIDVIPGGVLCHPDFPISVGSHLELKIYVLDISVPILVGSQVEFHTHHAKEAGKVAKILSAIDQKTKKASKKAPRFLTSKQSAVVEVILERAVCVEEFSSCRALGRAFLRSSGNTIAVGTISRIIDHQ